MVRGICVAKVSSLHMFVCSWKQLFRTPGGGAKKSDLLINGLNVTQRRRRSHNVLTRCISKLASRSHKRVRNTQNCTHHAVGSLISCFRDQAFLAYEANELPGLKEAKPGLKLRQYKQMLFEQVWNVLNRP